MTNRIYPKWKGNAAKLTANHSLMGNVKAALVSAAYVYSASHQFWSSASGALVGTTVALAGKTIVDDLFDADDVTFPLVTGVEAVALILFIDTGVPATSPLFAYFDEGIMGLPVLPSGLDITANFNAAGIVKL